MLNVVIAAFYQFVLVPDYEEMRQPLLTFCRGQQVKGSVLLAGEGINGTIAGSRSGVDAVLAYLRQDSRFASMLHKESFAAFTPFNRMKVRLKKEIVNLGVPGIDPNQKVGTYVEPAAWNDLISNSDVVLIDTRNDYEVEVGTFHGAVNPQTRSFNQFPAYVQQQLDPQKQKKVAMFCTGGIRCEKATAYLLQLGFEEVYHLKGGILNYLRQVPREDSLWEGECFVFDQRAAVSHDLLPGETEMCARCQTVLTEAERQSRHYKKGIYCPHCYESVTAAQVARVEERHKQLRLQVERSQADG